MGSRSKFCAEFEREAVELANQLGQTISSVAKDRGFGANVPGRRRRELNQQGAKAFGGQGVGRDQELMAVRRELAQVKKERVLKARIARRRSATLPSKTSEISGDYGAPLKRFRSE